MRTPRFNVHTLGCKVNRTESDSIEATLLDWGWLAVDAAQADIVIVNTCTVTGEAEHKNRKTIRKLAAMSKAPVLVTGCGVNIDAHAYDELDEQIFSETDKLAVPERACKLLGMPAPVHDGELPHALLHTGDNFRTRVALKVQDGCDNACTYCIVHTARGKARSLDHEAIVSQVDAYAQAGTHELVLTGIDMGAYDDEGLSLAGLLSLLLEKTSIERIRLSSIEPQSIDDALIEVIAGSQGRICPHLHIPLQSGSPRILSLMDRRYTRDEFLATIGKLRSAIAHIALSTDVIVGFPTEDEDDFADTISAIEESHFMRLHVFRYSKRPGTPAADMSKQVDPQISASRAETLRELGKRLAIADAQSRKGTREHVVVEKMGIGTGDSYHTVLVEGATAGGFIEVEYTGLDEMGRLVGRIL